MNGIRESQKLECAQGVTVHGGIETKPISRKRSKRDFYVYTWLDPRKPGNYVYGEYEFDYEPIYVGKGHGKRMNGFDRKYNKILTRKLKQISKPVVLKYKEGLFEKEAFDLEMNMVTRIGRKNLGVGPLCNLTDGGEGGSGHVLSKEHIEIIRKANTGKIISKEVKEKISKSKTGHKMSDEFRALQSHINTGKIISKEQRQKTSKALTGKPKSESHKQHIKKARKQQLPMPKESQKRQAEKVIAWWKLHREEQCKKHKLWWESHTRLGFGGPIVTIPHLPNIIESADRIFKIENVKGESKVSIV